LNGKDGTWNGTGFHFASASEIASAGLCRANILHSFRAENPKHPFAEISFRVDFNTKPAFSLAADAGYGERTR
jgi:hypothetical protein